MQATCQSFLRAPKVSSGRVCCTRSPALQVLCFVPKHVPKARQALPEKAPGCQMAAITVDGKQYVPLLEAQRFFEAGVRSGAVERIEMLEAQLRQAEAERDELAEAMRDEYSVHEREMKKLLGVALALEAEVEKRTAAVNWVAAQSVQEAEARLAEAFAAQLQAMHAQDVQQVEEGMHERLETLGHALRTAVAGKEQWRHRAMEAEEQLAQLKKEIQAGLEGARKAQAPRPQPGAWKQVDEE